MLRSRLGAIDFAEQFPHAEVIGNDLSPIQPTWVPPNVKFYVDDIEDQWNYEHDKFDFVHARYLAAAVRDWPRLVGQAFQNINPGGWFECQEWDYELQSFDNSLPPDSNWALFHAQINHRLESGGFDPSPAPKLEAYFKEAGFINVAAYRLIIPMGTWPKDPHLVCHSSILFLG